MSAISAAAALIALAVTAGSGQAISLSCGMAAAIVSAVLCSAMLQKSAEGKFIGSSRNQLIIAVGLGSLLRLALLAAALFSAVGLSGSPLTTGIAFIALFVFFRGSEIFFIRELEIFENEKIAAESVKNDFSASASVSGEHARSDGAEYTGGIIDEKHSGQETNP